MTHGEAFLFGAALLGGLALFIFGMNMMTLGLRRAAGNALRRVLSITGRSRLAGGALGTIMGLLVHSSATTVMLVGFVNAGLISLPEAIPPMLGANVGTTLSMQAISLDIGAYCYVAVTIGLLLRMLGPTRRVKDLGDAVFGFGLLFLGMNTMGDAIAPHKAALEPLLTGIDTDTARGLFAGIGLSTALTAVWQSSGATIGICFALARAGVFTDLSEIFPLLVGAHIGTCATALLGSIGTHIDARRAAVSHLLFNLLMAAVAVSARTWFMRAASWTSGDLVRQTANLNTIISVLPALLVLPLSRPFAALVRILTYSRRPPPERSFLDPALLTTPERAIRASIRELHRVALLCGRSFRLVADVMLLKYRRHTVRTIEENESVIDEVKIAMRYYLSTMTRRHLSRRQAILIQHVERCMDDIERIGDHIDAVCALSIRRNKSHSAVVPAAVLDILFRLYKAAADILHMVIDSLRADDVTDFQSTAASILAARDTYVEMSVAAKSAFAQAAMHSITPIAGMYMAEYVAAFDRIVRHAKSIALAEKHPDFRIKTAKLDRVEQTTRRGPTPELVNPHDFLDRLQLEEYL